MFDQKRVVYVDFYFADLFIWQLVTFLISLSDKSVSKCKEFINIEHMSSYRNFVLCVYTNVQHFSGVCEMQLSPSESVCEV